MGYINVSAGGIQSQIYRDWVYCLSLLSASDSESAIPSPACGVYFSYLPARIRYEREKGLGFAGDLRERGHSCPHYSIKKELVFTRNSNTGKDFSPFRKGGGAIASGDFGRSREGRAG